MIYVRYKNKYRLTNSSDKKYKLYVGANVDVKMLEVLESSTWKIKIGDNTKIDYILLMGDNIKIGSNCIIGGLFLKSNITIHNKCKIGNEVRLGNNVKILPGCEIGNKVVIGDNCVIEPNTKINDNETILKEYEY
jgi:UDP-3-O-[3-hydroxymyristoyl] glucosamine N-acyltransferase